MHFFKNHHKATVFNGVRGVMKGTLADVGVSPAEVNGQCTSTTLCRLGCKCLDLYCA